MRNGYVEREIFNGVQRIYEFANGRGASVVKHDFSYGVRQGLWEIGILDDKGELDYSTPITNNVIGHLTEDEVDNILDQIENLS